MNIDQLPALALLGLIVLFVMVITRIPKQRMPFGESIAVPPGTDIASLTADISHLLRDVGFTVNSAGPNEIDARRASPLGVADYVLRVRLSAQEVRLSTETRLRSIFLGLLPLTGCSLLCSLTCGMACASTCSCGGSLFVIGQAASGIRAYSRHLFQLVSEVVREKVRRGGNACQRCGTPLPAEAVFCRFCGLRLAGR